MARVVLIEASPKVNGVVVPTYLAGGGGERPYTYRGRNDWRSGLIEEPLFATAIGFDQAGWNGGAIPQTGAINFMSSETALLTTLAGYMWIGADVTVYVGDDAVVGEPAWTILMKGTIAAGIVKDGILSLTFADMATDLDLPVSVGTFTGAGGVEGIAEAEGRPKRRTFGRAFNIEGRILDKAYNIFEFGDPSFPWQSFDDVKDKGRSGPMALQAWAGSAAATLVALRATVPVQGGCVVAPSIACVKWWTQPSGPITADVHGEVGAGYVETAASVAQRIVSTKSALVISNVAAINVARPEIVGLHVGDSSETIATALDRLLLGVSLVWISEADGTIRLSAITFANPVETLDFIAVERVEFYKPIKSRRLGYKKNYRQHNDGEISEALTFGRGPWVAGVQYYIGDIVQKDGSSYQATVDHLSSDANKPPGANWTLLAAAGTGAWTPVLVNVSQSGANFTKSVGGAAFDASVYSLQAFVQPQVSFTVPVQAGQVQVGINLTNPGASAGQDIDYALHCSDGLVYAVSNASFLFSGASVAFAAGDSFQVSMRGTTLQFKKNNVLIPGWEVTGLDATLAYYLDSTFGSAAKQITNLTFGSAGDSGNLVKRVYKRAATIPATPTGNGVPATWTVAPPAENGQPLWMSEAVQTTGGTTLGTWTTPVEITGRDAVVFYQDATPTGQVTGDTWITLSGRIFRRWNGSAWVQLLGDVAALMLITNAYIATAAIGSLQVQDAAVTTLKIAGQSIFLPVHYTGSDVTVSDVQNVAPGMLIFESGVSTIGDASYGAATIDFEATLSTVANPDGCLKLTFYYKINGGSYVSLGTRDVGVRTDGGNTPVFIPFRMGFSVAGTNFQTLQTMVYAYTSGLLGGSFTGGVLKEPKFIHGIGKR